MAQVIKIQDYITRYEWDTFRYPTQYIRMKNDSWNRLYEEWSAPQLETEKEDSYPKKEEPVGIFSRLKSKLRKKDVESEVIQEEIKEEQIKLPKTEEELKQQFLNRLLSFQMKWATSTVTHQSIVDNEYYSDPLLKYLLQRFPDTYLVMYYPIFMLKQAPMEADIILISPIGIEVIQFIELEKDAVIMAGEERTWHIESPVEDRKILNPLLSVKRTEKVIKSILAVKDLDFSLKKTVLSRTNPIIFASEPYQTRIIGKEQYQDWFEAKRSLRSPLKSTQIKVAEALLEFCQSTSIKRPEWEQEENKEEEGGIEKL